MAKDAENDLRMEFSFEGEDKATKGGFIEEINLGISSAKPQLNIDSVGDEPNHFFLTFSNEEQSGRGMVWIGDKDNLKQFVSMFDTVLE